MILMSFKLFSSHDCTINIVVKISIKFSSNQEGCADFRDRMPLKILIFPPHSLAYFLDKLGCIFILLVRQLNRT